MPLEFLAFAGSPNRSSGLRTAGGRIGHSVRRGDHRHSEGPGAEHENTQNLVVMQKQTRVGGNGSHQAFPKYLVEPGDSCLDGLLQ